MVRRRKIGNMVVYVLLSLASVFSLFPIFWMASVSLRPNMEIFTIPPAWLPVTFTTEVYQQIFNTPQYIRMFANSYFVALAVTLVSLVLATLSGYGFSRFNFRGNRILQLFIIGTQMIPPISLIIPYFILIVTLQLYDTYGGLILTYTAFVLPFSTLMMISYFNTIPQDLEEAAMVDGCTRVGSLLRVVLPIVLPGLVATGVYAFLLAWNEFLFAVTLTQSTDMRLVPVGIAMLMGEHVFQWNLMMGLSVLASIPLLLVFLFLQKYLISGLTVGAVKG
ncbi:MAG: carbohydrate ABC transporter permease [Chloroflexota bacterium]